MWSGEVECNGQHKSDLLIWLGLRKKKKSVWKKFKVHLDKQHNFLLWKRSFSSVPAGGQKHNLVKLFSLRLTHLGASMETRCLTSDQKADVESSVQQLHIVIYCHSGHPDISWLLPPSPAGQRSLRAPMRHRWSSVDVLKAAGSSNDIRTSAQAAQQNANCEIYLETKGVATLLFWAGSHLKRWSSKTEANYQYVWSLEAPKILRCTFLNLFFWAGL